MRKSRKCFTPVPGVSARRTGIGQGLIFLFFVPRGCPNVRIRVVGHAEGSGDRRGEVGTTPERLREPEERGWELCWLQDFASCFRHSLC